MWSEMIFAKYAVLEFMIVKFESKYVFIIICTANTHRALNYVTLRPLVDAINMKTVTVVVDIQFKYIYIQLYKCTIGDTGEK